MEIEVEENPGWAGIPAKDLIVMAGNLLDNAIKAAKQCAQGNVHAALHAQGHFLVMEVENSYIDSGGKGPLRGSAKPDAGNHGFGISNVL